MNLETWQEEWNPALSHISLWFLETNFSCSHTLVSKVSQGERKIAKPAECSEKVQGTGDISPCLHVSFLFKSSVPFLSLRVQGKQGQPNLCLSTQEVIILIASKPGRFFSYLSKISTRSIRMGGKPHTKICFQFKLMGTKIECNN